MNKKNCPACQGQRWMIFTVSGSDRVKDGTLEVERCDECSEKVMGDYGAIRLARRAGLFCDDQGKVTKREAKRWMRLHPDGIKK